MYDKLTENDIKKMQEEIDYRKLVVRPKELEAVKEARAQGWIISLACAAVPSAASCARCRPLTKALLPLCWNSVSYTHLYHLSMDKKELRTSQGAEFFCILQLFIAFRFIGGSAVCH